IKGLPRSDGYLTGNEDELRLRSRGEANNSRGSPSAIPFPQGPANPRAAGPDRPLLRVSSGLSLVSPGAVSTCGDLLVRLYPDFRAQRRRRALHRILTCRDASLDVVSEWRYSRCASATNKQSLSGFYCFAMASMGHPHIHFNRDLVSPLYSSFCDLCSHLSPGT